MAKLKDIKGKGGQGNWELDSEKFDKMIKQLMAAHRPPLSFKDTLDSEALRVLQSAATKTKRSNINRIKGRYNPAKPSYIPFVKIDGKLYHTRNRYSNAMWSRIQNRLAYYKQRALDRVGLSKAIFYAIAKDSLKLPGYGRNWGADSKYIEKAYQVQKRAGKGAGGAKTDSKGNSKSAAPSTSWVRSQKGSKGIDPDNYVIKFEANTLNTLNPYAKGVAATQSAINGRVSTFNRAIKKNWFDDLKKLERNYPAVYVDNIFA